MVRSNDGDTDIFDILVENDTTSKYRAPTKNVYKNVQYLIFKIHSFV